MHTPTPRQQQVLDHIAGCLQTSGRPPTNRELAAHFGWKSDNAARQHLQLLIKKGLLKRDALAARGIRFAGPLQPAALRYLPMVGRVMAGMPIEAIENIEAQVGVDPGLFPESGCFCLRVQGDSMSRIGIRDGDIAVVHKTAEAAHGQVVVALLNGEATVKRLQRRGRSISLKPENPCFKEIAVRNGDEFEILGTVIGIIRRM